MPVHLRCKAAVRQANPGLAPPGRNPGISPPLSQLGNRSQASYWLNTPTPTAYPDLVPAIDVSWFGACRPLVIPHAITHTPPNGRERGLLTSDTLQDGIMRKALVSGTGKGRPSNADTVGENRSNPGMPQTRTSATQPPPAANVVATSPGNEAPGGSKTFEFVLVTDSESRKQVRRHAMRQYMRQRRLDGIARLESTRVQVSGWSNAGGPAGGAAALSPSPRVEELDERENTQNRTRTRSVSSSRRGVSSQPDSSSGRDDPPDNEDEVMLDILREFGTSDPKVTPGSGSVDPFNSYPLALNKSDQSLIHHFVTTYPMMMYKMGDAQQNNPIRGIFCTLALQDPVPFQAMLAIASKHLAGVEGQHESVQSLTHKMRALRLLNERLQSDVGDECDGTIYAAATMAVIEKWSKDPTIERMHIQGIQQLVRRRGGMRAMRATSPFLENVLYWVDLSCAPRAIMGASMPWSGEVPDTVPSTLPFMSPELCLTTTDTNTHETSDILQACEDFLTFFRSLEALQQSLIARPLPLWPTAHETSRREQSHHLFDPSTPLYSILTTLPDYNHGIRDIRFIDEYACMACLFYLNVALYDFYLTSRNFTSYLHWLSSELRKINPHSNPSISSLLWIFMGNGGYISTEPPDQGERSWFVSRMVRVAKRLEWTRRGTLWDYLRDTLLGFITTQQECGIGSDRITEPEMLARKTYRGLLWDEDEMRKDILGTLYTGPPTFSIPLKTESPVYALEPLKYSGALQPGLGFPTTKDAKPFFAETDDLQVFQH
ncbi:hypothetical protein FQN55_008473 [Onygenales sp. PD_40]|nr:hypothetical protein FQN55_008473 [Onygenales sp. PD_40]